MFRDIVTRRTDIPPSMAAMTAIGIMIRVLAVLEMTYEHTWDDRCVDCGVSEYSRSPMTLFRGV